MTAGLVPIVCIGETLDRARSQRDHGGARSADQGKPRSRHRRTVVRDGARLRARVGDRHRPQRDAGAGRRSAFPHSPAPQAVVRPRRVRAVSRVVWRKRQARQHRQADRRARCRRRAGRRRQPRPEVVLRDHSGLYKVVGSTLVSRQRITKSPFSTRFSNHSAAFEGAHSTKHEILAWRQFCDIDVRAPLPARGFGCSHHTKLCRVGNSAPAPARRPRAPRWRRSLQGAAVDRRHRPVDRPRLWQSCQDASRARSLK